MTTASQHVASDLKQLLQRGDTGPHVNQIQLNLQHHGTKTLFSRETKDFGYFILISISTTILLSGEAE